MFARRLALFTAAAVLSALRAGAAPEILVLLADDMRADAIHAHGGAAVRTPVLDRLAAEGFSFREAHCMGSNSGAVCVPSRAMLMTGRSWLHMQDPGTLKGETLLPEVLAAAGYQTFIAGKWHNGAASVARAFQRGEAVFLGGMTDQFHPKLCRIEGGKTAQPAVADEYSTNAIAAAAVKELDAAALDRPHFAWVAFTVPHDPRTSPPPYATQYDPATLPLPPAFLPQHPFDTGTLTIRDEQLEDWPRDPAAIRRATAAYYGMMSHLDEKVGTILAAFDRRCARAGRPGIAVFLADSGLALGSHGLLGKQSVYEHSTRAPFIIRGPGIPAGTESRALVYLHDLHPTLLRLAGAPAAPAREGSGQDLAPLWSASPPAGRAGLFLPYQNLMRAWRGPRWKIIQYPPIARTQIFDLEADPAEAHDLAPAQPERVKEMLAALAAAQQAHGDTLPLAAASPKSGAIDLARRKKDPAAALPPTR